MRIIVGRISGTYAVRGWMRVRSHTEPAENILGYAPWQIGGGEAWREVRLAEGRVLGSGVIARLEGIETREGARALVGLEIAILRRQLPALGEDDFYWADLIGLEVHTVNGERLGTVDHLLETGANDVLVVEGGVRHLVPFVWEAVVKRVSLRERRLIVDWDPSS